MRYLNALVEAIGSVQFMRATAARSVSLVMLVATIFALSLPSHACDYCNVVFADQLRNSGKPWAKEILQLASAERTGATTPVSATGVAPAKAVAGRSYPGLPPTSYVPPGTPPTKRVKITMTQGEVALGQGVVYKGFLINNQIPGPTIILEENDIVEFTVENKGDVPHGVSIHAAYTQTSKYLGNIQPNETKKLTFRVPYPGVYLYHCAPGGHSIPMHTLFGQYGMIVVKPKTKQYAMERITGRKPDIEIYLLQHEIYGSGKDAIESKPLYVMFNGKLFRYVESPIKARPGDYVRVYFLNVGPNTMSTFHLVGIVWDYAYWQGHPDNVFVGGQSVLAGPTDSWVLDFRAPEDEGNYLIVTHTFGTATRGAIGILKVDSQAERDRVVLGDGPTMPQSEFEAYRKQAVRIVSPHDIGTPDVDIPYIAPKDQKKVTVRIIGNSYYPKVVHVPRGAEVEWINEDVFTYAEGEFAGIHNVFVSDGPERFASPLLGHAERFTHTFNTPGEYEYICTPHPYMKGKIVVYDAPVVAQRGSLVYALVGVGGVALLIGIWLITRRR
jgi:nitrite reductase (NO-forming)